MAGYQSMRAFMVRLDSEGHSLWARAAPIDSFLTEMSSAAFDERGRALLACSRRPFDGAVIVMDSGGNTLWRGVSDGCDICYDAAAADDGTVFAAYGSTTTLSLWGKVLAYDTLGMLRWSDSSGLEGKAVSVGPDGRIAVAGAVRYRGFAVVLYAPRLGVAEPRSVRHEVGRRTWVAAAPNPFSVTTRFFIYNAISRAVRVSIHDCAGRLMRREIVETEPSGSVSWVWDGRDDEGRELGPGVFMARVESVLAHSAASPGGNVRVVKLR